MTQPKVDKIEEKHCPKCGKKMRHWFDEQVFTGWNCDDCFDTFIKVEEKL